MTDAIFALIGLVMLGGLLLIGGSLSRDDPRLRRWDARFDQEAHELRRTDATGVLRCRKCGGSGSERSGVCPRCGSTL